MRQGMGIGSVIVLLGVFIMVTGFPVSGFGEVPQHINYQGKLTDDVGEPLDGDYVMVFAIYDASVGGTALWWEEQTVTVTNGIYNVLIGKDPTGNPFPDDLFDDQRWLGLTVGTDAEMAPRQPLTSVPYALQAGGTSAGAVTAIMLADEAVTETKVATGAITAEKIVGGTGSGVDADLLDGLSSGAFLQTTGGTMTGALDVPYLKTDGSAVFKYDSGRSNILVGKSAGISNTTGINNTFLGASAGEQHQTGNNNVFLGQGAGQNHQSGHYNSFLGPWSGRTNQTGSYNVFIGANAGYNESGSYKLYIDDTSTNDPLIYGEFNNDLLEINGRLNVTGDLCIGQTTAGSKLHVVQSAQSLTYPLKVDNPDLLSSVGILFSVEGDGGIYSPERGKGALVYEKRSTWNRGTFHFLQDIGTNSDNPDLDDAVMSITNNGNVGIGTKYPGTRLEVADLTRVTNYTWPIAGEGLELGYNPAEDRGYVQAYDRGSGDWGELYLGHGTVGIGAESLDNTEWPLVYSKLRVTAHANPHSYAIGCMNTYHDSYAYLGGAYGIYANGPPDWYAGYFVGDVHVSGTLTKSGGSFKIDHPLEPESKYLNHSFVESPDMMNMYNGNVVLNNDGEAWVELPEWFETLNKDFRYQLTCIGGFAQVYIAQEIANNRFKIAGGEPEMKVSWQVTGIRQDPWANDNRIPVEEDKTDEEIGYYLHPESYGQPEEKGIEWARNPKRVQRMKEEREKRQEATS